MATPSFQELKDKLGDWLAVDVGRISDPVRGDCINLAIRDLARGHDLWLNEFIFDRSIFAGEPYYFLPEDYSRPHTFSYVNPDTGKRDYLDQKSYEEYEELFPEGPFGTTPGKPQIWTMWGGEGNLNRGQFTLGPTPDFDGTVSIRYYSVPPDLAASEENLFTRHAWEAIFFRALTYATRYLIEDPRKELWTELAREHELRLVIEHSRSRHSGRRLVMEEPG